MINLPKITMLTAGFVRNKRETSTAMSEEKKKSGGKDYLPKAVNIKFKRKEKVTWIIVLKSPRLRQLVLSFPVKRR